MISSRVEWTRGAPSKKKPRVQTPIPERLGLLSGPPLFYTGYFYDRAGAYAGHAGKRSCQKDTGGLKKSVDGEEAVKEIEKSKRSDGGVAANGAKRESERAHLSLPLLVARVQWLVVGRTQLSLRRRSTPQNVKKSDTFEEMQHRTAIQRESKRQSQGESGQGKAKQRRSKNQLEKDKIRGGASEIARESSPPPH